jgi:hypothetical protein
VTEALVSPISLIVMLVNYHLMIAMEMKKILVQATEKLGGPE